MPTDRFAKLVLFFEAAVCLQLIFFEITYIFDLDAYMEQAATVFTKGELNYSLIKGDTGTASTS
jgi:hypothetical protein